MRKDDFKLNQLENWVREKSPFKLPEYKYPVVYGNYGDPRTEIDERKIVFHKQYWEFNVSDLSIIETTLIKQFEDLSREVYLSSASMLLCAKDKFAEAKYVKFKNRGLGWILATTEINDNGKKATGISKIDKIDPVKWDVEKCSYSLMFRSIARANTVREDWIYTYEKIEVVRKFINAKVNKEDAVYAPPYADRVLLLTNKHGKEDYAIEPLWDSGDEVKKLSIDERIDYWLDKNIPQSPYKKDYKRAFKVICEQPDPKKCGRPYLLDKIHERFEKDKVEPQITDQSIRKKIPLFINTFNF